MLQIVQFILSKIYSYFIHRLKPVKNDTITANQKKNDFTQNSNCCFVSALTELTVNFIANNQQK